MQSIKVYPGCSNAFEPEHKAHVLFKSAWELLSKYFRVRQADLSTSLFRRLESFVVNSHAFWIDSVFHPESPLSENSIRHIPTALILTGVNTPDHRLIYSQVRSSVLRNGGRVAFIPPGSNTTSLRALLSEVVRQITSNTDCVTEMPWVDEFSAMADDDDFCDTRPSVKSSLDTGRNESHDDNLKHLTLSVRSTYAALVDWYYAQPNVGATQLRSPDATKHDHSPRRSVSQPASPPVRRTLRSSLFTVPRKPTLPRQLRTRRLTELPNGPASVSLPTSPQVSPRNKVPRRPTVAKETSSGSITGRGGPLVVILPQIETIAGHILDSFIQLTATYIIPHGSRNYGLPIYLMLGLSTPPEAGGFESRLSASTLSRLGMQRFTVPPPATLLDALLTELIYFPGFHLTPSCLSYLVDSLFLYLDYSVENFIRRVKFCMLEHYLNTPHIELLSPSPRQTLPQLIKSLSASELAQMISTTYPSLSALATHTAADYCTGSHYKVHLGKSLSSKAQGGSHIGEHLITCLQDHWCLLYQAPRVLNWLLTLLTTLFSGVSPLGTSLIQFYRRWLQHGLVETDEFKLTLQVLRGTSEEAWSSALLLAAGRLAGECEEQAEAAAWPIETVLAGRKRLEKLVRDTRNWASRLGAQRQDSDQEGSSIQVDEEKTRMDPPVFAIPSTVPSTPKTPSGRKVSMRGLRQHIQELAAASPARFSPLPSTGVHYQKQHALNNGDELSDQGHLVAGLLSWLRFQLSELLPQPSSLPLHEVFYGPVVQQHSPGVSFRRRFNPPLQRCLHQALMDPCTYLHLPEYALPSPDSLSKYLPDLCILYKLHCESLKQINLYDWLLAFATVLGEAVDKQNPPSKLIQARFLHGLAQLHHLGYVKSTARKVDYVARLTHGFVG